MPRLVFTQQLARFVEAPEIDCDAATLREALEAAFQLSPRLRGYVLDEQGHVRKHVVIFIDGIRIADRINLSDSLKPASEVYVLQALSGG